MQRKIMIKALEKQVLLTCLLNLLLRVNLTADPPWHAMSNKTITRKSGSCVIQKENKSR